MADKYEQLRASGLPITWKAIHLGREAGLITDEQAQSYAADRLGLASPGTEYLVFRLFDADPTNRWEIRSVLEQLAESEWPEGDDAARRETIEAAERTWNLLAIREFLRHCNALPRPLSIADSGPDGVFFYLELLSTPDVRLAFPDVFDFELPEEINRTKPMYAYVNSDWPLFGAALATLAEWADGQEETLLAREN